MAKTDNLSDFLTDVANSIRTKTQTTDPINAQDFSNKILSIPNTLKKLLDTTKSAEDLFKGYNGTSVDGLIQYSDTENVTNMSRVFEKCSFLRTAPLLDTSNATEMSGMFFGCTRLTTIPQLDTSKVENILGMFNSCAALTTIPLLDTSKVTNMNYMFNNCTALTTIPQLNVSNVIETMYMFYGCTSLKSILMQGMKVSFDISASTQFEREDLLVILNNLATVTSTQTLTMGVDNLAKLTEEDKAIATNKGWTLA